MRQNGTVKFFNQAKGYGFISPEGGGKDVFVHITAVQRSGIPELSENMKISFEIQPDKVYVIAALFDPENETDPKAYWRPVLLEETAGACKP